MQGAEMAKDIEAQRAWRTHTHTHTYTHTYIHKHTYIPLHSAEMAKDIEAQRAWRRSTMAPQSTRAGLLMPYTQQVR